MFTKRRILMISGVVVIILCVSIILFSAPGFVNPYHSVSEVSGDTTNFMNRHIQMIGNVTTGSIHILGQDISFKITDGTSVLDVVYSGAPPQNFVDNVEVVIAGSLILEDTFKATEILTKCPSKYE